MENQDAWLGIRNELLQKDEIINGVSFIGDIVEVSNPDALKKLCFDLKNNLNNYVVVLCANIGGKPSVAVSIDEKVVAAKNLDAGKIIKEVMWRRSSKVVAADKKPWLLPVDRMPVTCNK